MANKPYAIDIYYQDDVVDLPGKPLAGFDQVKAYGIAFLDHKATESTGWKDPRVASRYEHWMTGDPVTVTDVDGAVLQIPPKFGFYHFNGPMTNIQAEVDNFLSVVKPLYNKGDDLCIDWEAIGASAYQVGADKIDEWCQRVEQWCGFPIKVYGGNVPREQFQRRWPSALVDRFTQRRLWFCEYNPVQTHLPLPWIQIGSYLWQDDGDKYGPGPHYIPGMHGYCDNSTVAGNMTVAHVLAGWGTAPSPLIA